MDYWCSLCCFLSGRGQRMDHRPQGVAAAVHDPTQVRPAVLPLQPRKEACDRSLAVSSRPSQPIAPRVYLVVYFACALPTTARFRHALSRGPTLLCFVFTKGFWAHVVGLRGCDPGCDPSFNTLRSVAASGCNPTLTICLSSHASNQCETPSMRQVRSNY
jgi:hypothetical protein